MGRRDATLVREKTIHTSQLSQSRVLHFHSNKTDARDTGAEEPETPAPVFAARAIKSAIFGTPAPPPGDTTLAERLADFTNMPNIPQESPSKPPGILMTPGTARTRKTVSFGGGVKQEAEKKESKSGIPDDCPGKFPSPWVPKERSKLGEGSSRRTELTRSLEKVRDTRRKVDEEKKTSRFPSIPDTPIPEKRGGRDVANRFPSIPDTPILDKTNDNDGRPRSRRGFEPDVPMTIEKIDVTTRVAHKELVAEGEGAKGERRDRVRQSVTPMTIEEIDVATRLTHKQLLAEGEEAEAKRNARVRQLMKEASEPETTVDLDHPRSKSGRYWKAEYEAYHEDAIAQMKKLVRYRQLAKDYAKMMDEDNLDLKLKLVEEQIKVGFMEEKIQELAGRMADNRLNGEEDSPGLMKVLARQTELAVKYKNEVDKFRIAMENRESDRKERKSSSEEEDTGRPTDNKQQYRAMGSLRDDMENMRISLTAAEKRAKTLEQENAKLSRDLARTKEDLLQSEKRREAAEDRNTDATQLLEELKKNYDNLKEAAKSQRRDAEHLLKRRADQVADLKREIKSLKRASRHHGEESLRERSTSRHKEELELDERGLKRRSAPAQPSSEVVDVVVEAHIRPAARTRTSSERRRPNTAENVPSSDPIKEDRARRSSQPEDGAVKPRRSRTSLNDYLSDARKDRASRAPRVHDISHNRSGLAEISNTTTAREGSRSISPVKRQTTNDSSLRQRFTTLSNKARDERPQKAATSASYDSPLKPDSETAESTQQVRISSNTAIVGAAQPSPRVSKYNFTQDDTPTPRVGRYLFVEDGEDSRLVNQSMRSNRTDLDPERAAAAKARLEKRNRERRRANGSTQGSMSTQRKENVRMLG